MRTNYYKNEKGFSIIETLVALTIFSIAITGVITVAARGGVHIDAAKNRVIATYLADEGIELMRGMRDTEVLAHALASDGWLRFVTVATTNCSTTPCDIDGADSAHPTDPLFPQFDNFITSGSVAVTGASGMYYPIYYDESTGYYGDLPVLGSKRTQYHRALTVARLSPDEIQVTATVVWREGTATRTMTQTESIFNWYES